MMMLKSRISLKLGTIDGFGEILTSTKNKVAILNSLGFTGTPPLKITKSTHFCIINCKLWFGCSTSRKDNLKSNQFYHICLSDLILSNLIY